VLPVVLIADRVLPLLLDGASLQPVLVPPQFAAEGLMGGWLFTNLVLVGVVTPIEEEILYRGVIYGWLRSFAGKRPAFVLSAVIFALVHISLGHTNVVLAFVLGLVAAWMYERSGSILPAIGLHIGWNTATTLSLGAAFAAGT
jgi:membrane protease YdiL (CAAX protease family)